MHRDNFCGLWKISGIDQTAYYKIGSLTDFVLCSSTTNGKERIPVRKPYKKRVVDVILLHSCNVWKICNYSYKW